MPRPLDAPRESLRVDGVRGSLSSDAREAGTITGRHCIVAFDPDQHEIRFDGAAQAARFTVRVTGRPGPAQTSAHGFTRDVDADRAALTERCFVFHDLPLAVLEWAPRQPVPDGLIHLEMLVRAGPGPLWRTGEGAVRIDAPDRVLILLTTADVRLAARDDLGAVRVDAALPVGPGPARIAFAAALLEGDDIDSILDAARNVDGRVRARTASLRRRDRESIRLHSPSPIADAALRTAVGRHDAVPLLRAFGPARNALPVDGRPPDVRDTGPEVPPWTGALDDIGSNGRLALAALIAGDPAPALELTGPDGADPHGLLARLGWAWTGDRAFLPAGSVDAEPPDIADDPPPAGTAARRIVALHPVLPDSVAGPIIGLAMDLLGAAPDAARGRLRLRPVLPDGWQFMEVAGLPMADARIRLRMTTTDHGVDIRIEQTHGAVPIRAILEPVVTARALVGATVDGQPASLVPRPLGNRIRVPVQLALDSVRRLVLQLA